MTATIAEIRQGLADRLATIAGLHVSPYMQPRVEAPAACVLPSRAEFNRTMNSDDTDYQFDLWIYCSPTVLVQAQERIDEYLAPSGAKSFRAAVHADVTLGRIVSCCYVRGWSGYATLLNVAGTEMLGASVQCEVEA